MNYSEDAFQWPSTSLELGVRDSYDNGKFCALTGSSRIHGGENPHALVERGGFLVRCPRCVWDQSRTTQGYCTNECTGGSLFSVGAVLDYVPTEPSAATITVYAKEEEWFTKPIYRKMGWSKGKDIGSAVIERKRKRQNAEHEHVKTAARTVIFEGIVPYNISLLDAMVQDDLSTAMNVGQPLYAGHFGMTLSDKPDPNNAFVGTYFGAIPESPGEIYVLLSSPVIKNNFIGLSPTEITLLVTNTNTNDILGTLVSIERLTENNTWDFKITYKIGGAGPDHEEFWAQSDNLAEYHTNTDKKKEIVDNSTKTIKYTNTVFKAATKTKNMISELSKKDGSPFVLPLF